MIQSNSEKADSIQQSVAILSQALDKLDSHDYASALIMVGVAKQILSDVQWELDQHLCIEHRLKHLIKN